MTSLGEKPEAGWFGQDVFRERNRAFQEKYQIFFQPYHRLCRGCGSRCCLHTGAFNAVDYLLLGDVETYHLSKWDLMHAFKWVTKLWQAAGVGRLSDQNQDRCPCLTEMGCLLSWGQRPIICVVHLCYPFCQAMTWRPYWKYLCLTTRYLMFISVSLRNRIVAMRERTKDAEMIRGSEYPFIR